MEDALGEKATSIALTAAGRTRGKNLTNSLGLAGSNIPSEEIASKQNQASRQSLLQVAISLQKRLPRSLILLWVKMELSFVRLTK